MAIADRPAAYKHSPWVAPLLLPEKEQVKECKGVGITEDGAGQGGDEENREIKGLTGLTGKNTHSCKNHFRARNRNNEIPENNGIKISFT